ncbi:MAG: hypothetical protein WDZ88_00090 [Candidatus Paceibacterota bacterium]
MQNIFSSKKIFILGLITVIGIAFVATLSGVFVQAQAHKFVFIEGGKAYLSSDLSASKIADNVEGMLAYNPTLEKYLYRIAQNGGDGHNHDSGSLVLADSNTGKTHVITTDVMTAALSPDGTQIAVWNGDNEIYLMTADGNEIARIGVHGALPVFSHDGTYVAYNKLAEEGDRFFDLSEESPYGIAIYNLKTGEEEIITENVHDFQPLGFSADMSKLYFNSGRAYETTPEGFSNHVASLWVVDLKTKEVARLTNTDEEAVRRGDKAPIIHATALWSSDRKTVISSLEAESGVWQFSFSDDGKLVDAKQITDGTSPRWVVPGESIAVRTKVGNRNEWKTINIK